MGNYRSQSTHIATILNKSAIEYVLVMLLSLQSLLVVHLKKVD